jgi:hypothetical protein
MLYKDMGDLKIFAEQYNCTTAQRALPLQRAVEEAAANKPMIDINKIKSVYSGRPGCCCGCRGKYTYAKKFQDESSKARGYKVTDDECNDRVVRMIVNKMNKDIGTKEEDGYYMMDTGSHWYIAHTIA